MKFNIQKYYYKLFDNKKYQKLKEQGLIQESVKIFENKYKSYLFGIENKIKNNKKITKRNTKFNYNQKRLRK